MEIIPKKALEEARIGRDIERTVIEQHRQMEDIAPFALKLVEAKNRAAYPLAVATHSIKAHIDRLRGVDEVVSQPEA